MSHERLAQLIQAHQGAILAHPEAQATHEAIISLLQGVDTCEITEAHRLRVLRAQAVLGAEVPASAARSRQAAADLRQMSGEEQCHHRLFAGALACARLSGPGDTP